jgi:hypothetical protein
MQWRSWRKYSRTPNTGLAKVAFDYCGGNLTIGCKSIKLFDQNKNELSIDQIDKICNKYWDEWSKK